MMQREDTRSAKKEDKTGPDDTVSAEKSAEESQEDEDEDSEVCQQEGIFELISQQCFPIWNKMFIT